MGSVVNGYHPVGYVACVIDWLSSLEYDLNELLVLPGMLADVTYDCELVLSAWNGDFHMLIGNNVTNIF